MGCLYTLLDLPSHVENVRRNMRGWGFAASFIIFLICSALMLPVFWAWWAFDQVPTWDWTTPIRDQLLAAVPYGDVELAGQVVSVALVASVAIWLFNASPTLIELAFPRASRGVPALALLLKVAIVFDYVTDFPALWKATTAFAWPAWGLLTPLLQFVACAFATLVVSMVLQVVLGVLLMMLWVCVENMYLGGAQRVARQVIIAPPDQR
jgi:hypothetical protein